MMALVPRASLPLRSVAGPKRRKRRESLAGLIPRRGLTEYCQIKLVCFVSDGFTDSSTAACDLTMISHGMKPGILRPS